MASPYPTLHLLVLSDSFHEIWPIIASECGLALSVVINPETYQASADQVSIICAGGAEESVESLVRRINPGAADLAVVGALPNHRLALAAVRAGAREYFVLPEDYELLRTWVLERAERLQLRIKGRAFAAQEAGKYRFDEMLGQSGALHEALGLASRIIPHPNVTVLITGETGTGKELLARAIHYNGPRRECAYVDINCAAIPEQLLESELFGHEMGSFTGATSAKPGLCEIANRGTLFLDEIGHMPLSLQGKLLRVLEQRTVRRVGATRSNAVDLRFIAATNVDLARAVRAGTFREDLFYRLNVMPIELPPLRGRMDDIVPLANHFLAHFAQEYSLSVPRLTPAAVRALQLYAWPGNIRELRNMMERAVVLAPGSLLDVDDLSFEEARMTPEAETVPFPASLVEIIQGAAAAMITLCGGNKSEAARRLGISRTRLLRVLHAEYESKHQIGDQS